MWWLAFIGVAAADPALSITGDCPGRLTIDITEATPRGTFAVLAGLGFEDDTLGIGPCAGTRTDLSGIRMLTLHSTSDGRASFRPVITGAACATPIQVLDVETCTLSEALILGGGGAPGAPRTFTTCGNSGPDGPDDGQCSDAYASTTLEGEVTVIGGIQEWTVPATGVYRIAASGAQGGTSDSNPGGQGAHVEGDFFLTRGDELRILVGQMGKSGGTYDYGGGGGSFVAMADDTPLIVAGGGAVAGNCGDKVVGDTEAGTSATGDGNGGSGGNDGGWCGCGGDGSPGGGFFTSGIGDGAGESFLSGGRGGSTTRPGQCIDPGWGGFGGGGNSGNGGGGGGGYQGGFGGGSGSPEADEHRGQGGFSYNAGTSPTGVDGAHEGDGTVVITPL